MRNATTCYHLASHVLRSSFLRAPAFPSFPTARMSSSTSIPPTKPIYQFDETLRTHLTQITAVTPLPQLSEPEQSLFKSLPAHEASAPPPSIVETKETIFYAQGGGQPYDTGYIAVAGCKTRFNVKAVRYGEAGRILHFGTFTDEATFEPGDMVEQHIDGQRRDLNSRSHTAGHIIGLAVRRLAEKEQGLSVTELKASHYPDASFVEFKGLIDGKYKDAIQAKSTEYVKAALPVKLSWYKPEELGEKGVITAEGMPIVAGTDGNVRVVDIVGAGAYPCGGTHVQHTGLVGGVVVKGIKRQKGVSKVSYTISAGS